MNLNLKKPSRDFVPEFAQTARIPPSTSSHFFPEEEKIKSVGSDQQLQEIFTNFREQVQNSQQLLSDPVSQSIFKKLMPAPLRHYSIEKQNYLSFGEGNLSQKQTKANSFLNNDTYNLQPKPNFEEFKQFITELHQVHGKKCGKNCIHLKRFYEKLGLAQTWNRKMPYDIHQKIINKLPMIWQRKDNLEEKTENMMEIHSQL